VRIAPLALLLLGLGAATAPAAADDWATCNNTSGDQAIAACNRAIDSGRFKGEDLGKLLTSRGVERKRKGDIDGAIADYTRAIALNSKDLFAFNNRANTRRDKGDLDGAIADYGEALRLDPDYAAAYTNRGRVHEMRGDLVRARADFSSALAAAPDKYDNSRWAKDFARARLNALAKSP
jgi:tetratricopeptide (TPR) repeat protein